MGAPERGRNAEIRPRRGVRVALEAFACAAIAGVALAGPAAAEAIPEPGAPFRSVEGGFSAPFPEAPLFAERREATLLGMLRTRSWEVERGTLRLRVERHDLPALASATLGGEALLERAARELLVDAGARAVQAAPARLRAHPGRHLRYEPGERPGEIEDAWLYLLGRRLYVILARGGAPALDFAASVEIADE